MLFWKWSMPWLVLIILLLVAAQTQSFGQESSPGPTETLATGLTEVESLKGQVLQLRYDSVDKQMRLMQAQYAGLQVQQQALIGDLQALEAEVVTSRGLTPGEWAVNWQGKTVEKQPSRDREGADKKEDQDGSE